MGIDVFGWLERNENGQWVSKGQIDDSGLPQGNAAVLKLLEANRGVPSDISKELLDYFENELIWASNKFWLPMSTAIDWRFAPLHPHPEEYRIIYWTL